MTPGAQFIVPFGSDLLANDYEKLEARWITRESADAAGLRRVDSYMGRQMFGRTSGDLAGIIIPYVAPGDNCVLEYRLRVDRPELEYHGGKLRETKKYIQPPGRRNRLYLPPGVGADHLDDASMPVVITEGELKALALWRLANFQAITPRFLPVSVAGVYNWRGVIAKEEGPDGERRDVKGVIPEVERIALKGRRFIIAYDADAEENRKVRAARWQLAAVLIERGGEVGYLDWPIDEGKGIDDRLAKIGPEKVLANIEAIEFGDWHTRLLRNDRGNLISCYENVALFLCNSHEWAGVLSYNEFSGAHFAVKPPPDPITTTPGSELDDGFDIEAVRWFERRGLMVKPDLVRRVVDAIARRNSHHPVREYLESLPDWDGKARIGSWLIDYCGVESSDANPNRYAMGVGEMFLISAVARVLEPGCKVDHVLVLEGEQGIGKSTAAQILGGDWFTDQVGEIGSKDAAMQVRGVWIIELSELGCLGRSETAREKAFITQRFERFRLPYGHRVVQVPRQCVFIATTNLDSWLKDETGGRRYWPVRCGGIDLNGERRINTAGSRRDRDQIAAEALVRYRSGVKWWPQDLELVQHVIEEQRGRYIEDPWQQKIAEIANELVEAKSGEYPNGRGSVSIREILGPLGVETAKQDQQAANRVSRCLRAEGWERVYVGPRGAREWRYRRKVCQS